MPPFHLPEIWKIDPDSPCLETMKHAASRVKEGGILLYPTETFYGLGGDPFQPAVIHRIFSVKGRDRNKPLPLIAADMESVLRAAAHWPDTAERLARAFWPGPLSLLLAASPEIPEPVHASTGKVALRISSHPVARLLAAGTGGLIISTSANLSGEPPANAVENLSPGLLSQVDAILDAGPIETRTRGLPSTIVDVTGVFPRLARDGFVPWRDIEEHLK